MRDTAGPVSDLFREHLNQPSNSGKFPACAVGTESCEISECLSSKLFAKLELFGLDIVAPLALDWYNTSLPNGTPAKIPSVGKAGSQALTLLVGNTKHIWEPFLAACMEHPQLLELTDPLDAYVERSVEAVLQDTLPTDSCRVFYGHRKSPHLVGSGSGSSGYVALQRMAQAAGIAFLDEDSHLCMHPKYGPWFALRAVLVFDCIPHTGEQPRQLNSPLDPATRHYIKLAVKSANRSSSDLSFPPSDLSPTVFESPDDRPVIPAADIAVLPSLPPLLGPDVRVHLQHIQQQQHRPQAETAANETNRVFEGDKNHVGCVISGTSTAVSSSRQQQPAEGGDTWALRAPTGCAVRAQWHKWVAIRDAPCAGHPWRYPKHQLTYHYTGDRTVLRRLISAATLPPDAVQRRAVEAEVSSPTTRRRRNSLHSISTDHVASAASNRWRCSLEASTNGKGSWPLSPVSDRNDASAKREPQGDASAELSAVCNSSSSTCIRSSSSSPSLRRPGNHHGDYEAAPERLRSLRVQPFASMDGYSERPNRLSISSRPGDSEEEASTSCMATLPCPPAAKGPAASVGPPSHCFHSEGDSRNGTTAAQAIRSVSSSGSHTRRKGMSGHLLEASPPSSDEEESAFPTSWNQYSSDLYSASKS